MNQKDFEALIAGLNDALSFARGRAGDGMRKHEVKVDHASKAAPTISEVGEQRAKRPRPDWTIAERINARQTD